MADSNCWPNSAGEPHPLSGLPVIMSGNLAFPIYLSSTFLHHWASFYPSLIYAYAQSLANSMTPRNRWTKSNKFVAVKICTCNVVQNESPPHELDISVHLSSVKSQHRGRAILGTAIESFGLDSPNGSSHLALVFEPMREPLWLFRRRIMGQDKATRPWMPLVKGYIQILLEGLDFLHQEGHMIHTGTLSPLISLSCKYVVYSLCPQI
jgi:hypothetical protein